MPTVNVIALSANPPPVDLQSRVDLQQPKPGHRCS
jgi:hypothetical protein